METRGAGARWTRLDARAVATEVSLSGAARTRDAGVEGEDDDDDDWVVVRAPAPTTETVSYTHLTLPTILLV